MKTLVLALLPLIALTITCDEFLTQLEAKDVLSNSYDLTPQENMLLAYSAKASTQLADLGNQEECNSSPLMKYFLSIRSIYIGFQHKEERGLCLPKECDNRDSLDNPAMIQQIYRILKWPYGSPVESYTLYDPTQRTAKGPLFYITVFLFAFIIILNIGCTVYIQCFRNKEVQRGGTYTEIDKLLVCFDLKTNMIDFYKTPKEQNLDENISALNIMRMVTSYVIITYHWNYIVLSFGGFFFENLEYTISHQREGSMFVEYFFIIAGFLAGCTLVPKLTRTGLGFGVYFDLLKHRIVRLWPILFFGVMLHWQVTYYLSEGPRWFYAENLARNCTYPDVLSTILLATNLKEIFDSTPMCDASITWYLSTETQMFMIGILVAGVFAKSRKLGYGTAFSLIFQSFIQSCIYFITHNYNYFSPSYGDSYLSMFYPHFQLITCKRWSSYFLSMSWGFMYYEYKKLNKRNIFAFFEDKPVMGYISIILGVAVNFSAFGVPNLKIDRSSLLLLGEIWVPLRYILVTIAIMMTFTPIMSNRPSLLKSFFNLRLFQVLAKICYCKYMFHMPLVYLFSFGGTPLVVATGWSRIALICIGATIVATIAYLMIENPLMKVDVCLENKERKKMEK